MKTILSVLLLSILSVSLIVNAAPQPVHILSTPMVSCAECSFSEKELIGLATILHDNGFDDATSEITAIVEVHEVSVHVVDSSGTVVRETYKIRGTLPSNDAVVMAVYAAVSGEDFPIDPADKGATADYVVKKAFGQPQ